MEQTSSSKYPMIIETIIIDDHILVNDGLSLILQESGYFKVVEKIYDSRHASLKCFLLKPHLIIIDYNMPHLNGLEVVKQLKALKCESKIVVVSMYAETRETMLFKEVGVDAYISKITPSQELVEILKKVMDGEKLFEKNSNKKTLLQKDIFALKHDLTKREIEILKLIKQGFTTQAIANTLELSHHTIDTHRKNVNKKMKFNTKKEFYDFLNEIE